MIGVAAASSLVFLLTRFLGVRLVEIFISREKIDELRFINSEEKLKRMIFLLFFIPGTPKDLLTYFAGLTRIKLHEFLIISMIARIPSLVSSTIGGTLHRPVTVCRSHHPLCRHRCRQPHRHEGLLYHRQKAQEGLP